LEEFADYRVILTYPNADNGGRAIIPLLEDFAARHTDRVLAIPSLGFRRYLSVVARSSAVVGNSSSGIIEVPSLGVPTVNIGMRQAGRLCADSVLACPPDKDAIVAALALALSAPFAQSCRDTTNPYGQGEVAEAIVAVLETCDLSSHKTFHDLS